jgi:phosphate transport system permease protein
MTAPAYDPSLGVGPQGGAQSRPITLRRSPGDLAFRGLARGAGTSVLVMIVLVGGFLLLRGWTALRVDGVHFLNNSAWEPDSHNFGVAGVITGSVLIGVTAIILALPLALGTALYISEYAPASLKRTLVALVDLMAAIPSVVYGLWGFLFLQQHVIGVSRFVSTYFGWIPLFKVNGANPHDALIDLNVYSGSTVIAGMTVALMVTPIACSVMREAFSQAPLGEREGAYALGATRWGMIRTVVLPFGRGGIIGGTMLGLGRALGETIAVYLIISFSFGLQPHVLQAGASSVASLIANRYGAASAFEISALMLAGLALFTLTLIVNFGASIIVARSRSGAVSEA